MISDIDAFSELFEIQTRGALAAAFTHANLKPSEHQWELLRGKRRLKDATHGQI